MRTPTNLTQIEPRFPVAGRVRLGVKTGNAMKSIDTLRFTSQHRDLIERIAVLYGGTVKEWNEPRANPPNQWEVISETATVPVVLYPGGISQWYEMWTRGGCQRRCDGIHCQVFQGDDLIQVDCLCTKENQLQCKAQTRVSFLMPDLPMRGAWRLDTKSTKAMHQLPTMDGIIRALGKAPLVKAVLGVEQQQQVVKGRTQHFVVPTLTIDETLIDAVEGGGLKFAIDANSPMLALPIPVEREIIDAELVDADVEEWRASVLALVDDPTEGEAVWSAIERTAHGEKPRIARAVKMIMEHELDWTWRDGQVEWVRK